MRVRFTEATVSDVESDQVRLPPSLPPNPFFKACCTRTFPGVVSVRILFAVELVQRDFYLSFGQS